MTFQFEANTKDGYTTIFISKNDDKPYHVCFEQSDNIYCLYASFSAALSNIFKKFDVDFSKHFKEYMKEKINKLESLIKEREKEMENKKWMQDAVKPENKGKLRKKLHVKSGENIPAKKLAKAAHSKNTTLKKEAVLAETFKKVRNK